MGKDQKATYDTESKWQPADLDRCEHGRHSLDSCFECPYGRSAGNLFLTRYRSSVKMTWQGRLFIRIGTNLNGDPIWVCPNKKLGPEAFSNEPCG